eukprot:TRINITY_DN57146_c0_g1_i1.p1 TRINITY_DN57146_c0_g1~~TRINITY_DN57146_c0_g1_i1.p1  ORF type:complete len:358 (+),score=45.87 TRINITY_DN57146_c0_g1_i1:78-1151(+)
MQSVARLRCLAPAAIRHLFFQSRGVTTKMHRFKMEERKHGGERDFMEDNREKRRLRSPRQGVRSHHLSELDSELKKMMASRRYEDAWEAFESSKVDADLFLTTTALQLCARAAWPDRAWTLWEKLGAKDVVAYTAMIDVCARAMQPDRAEHLFAEMRQMALAPNIITYNAMINAFGTSEQPQRAKETFASIPPDVFSGSNLANKQAAYLAVMTACARAGDYASCRGLFSQLTASGIQVVNGHFNALLSACAKHEHAGIAQGVFDLIPQYNLKPSILDWNILLSCNRSDLPRCIEIVEQMRLAKIEPTGHTYMELLAAHVLAKDGQGARQLIEDMGKFGRVATLRKMKRLLRETQALP